MDSKCRIRQIIFQNFLEEIQTWSQYFLVLLFFVAWGLAYLCVGHFLTNFSKFSLRNADCFQIFLHNFHIILWIQIFKNSEVKAKIWIVAVLSFMFSRLCLKLFKTMEQQVTCNLLSQMVHYYSLVHGNFITIDQKKKRFYMKYIGSNHNWQTVGGHRGRDRMVVGFTTTFLQSVSITTEVVSLNPTQARWTRYNIMW